MDYYQFPQTNLNQQNYEWLIQQMQEATNEIGNLSDLQTADKSNLVAAINEAAQGGGGGGAVQSVNGKTGIVVLNPSDIGAIAAPSSPATGAFLVWSGSAWIAQTLATWQGGSY